MRRERFLVALDFALSLFQKIAFTPEDLTSGNPKMCEVKFCGFAGSGRAADLLAAGYEAKKMKGEVDMGEVMKR